MNGILVNIMANSISFIETSFRTTGFHLFVHLHENYWPAVDRYIKWDEHFYPVGREKLQICKLGLLGHVGSLYSRFSLT